MPRVSDSKHLTTCGWDEVPHLGEAEKAKMLRETQPYMRDARSKGTPSLGAGAIYPVEEDVYLCDPFPIPAHWRRSFALDVGWKITAGLWGAIDPDTGLNYLYAEHYLGRQEPSIHANAIKARGDWIPGVIDPAARGRSQIDGRTLMQSYVDLGLVLVPANNAVEAGIQMVWELLSSGRLKVFRTLGRWRQEHKFYRRDEKGHIVKEDDHLMDTTRYWVVSGRDIAIVKPADKHLINVREGGDSKMGY